MLVLIVDAVEACSGMNEDSTLAIMSVGLRHVEMLELKSSKYTFWSMAG